MSKELTIYDMPAGFFEYMGSCDRDDLSSGAWQAYLQDSARMFYKTHDRKDLLKADDIGYEGFIIYCRECANHD